MNKEKKSNLHKGFLTFKFAVYSFIGIYTFYLFTQMLLIVTDYIRIIEISQESTLIVLLALLFILARLLEALFNLIFKSFYAYLETSKK